MNLPNLAAPIPAIRGWCPAMQEARQEAEWYLTLFSFRRALACVQGVQGAPDLPHTHTCLPLDLGVCMLDQGHLPKLDLWSWCHCSIILL